MRARLILLALVGVVVLGGLPAHALGAAERPTNQKLYTDGYDDRMLLGGQWLLKRDRLNVGQQRHFERQRGTAGWSPITVPPNAATRTPVTSAQPIVRLMSRSIS